VDAGVSSDMDGHHRPYNLSPDIGADELIATVVSPGSASTLIYTDTRGSPTVIYLPAGAVGDPITLVYTPVDTATAPSGLAFADHAFELEGYQGETPLPGLALQLPATVTIHFTETDVAGLSKASLVLTYWNEGTSAWEDAACGPYDRRPEDSWLAVPIGHLSRFALFGEETHTVYLPIVLRAP
jgi:hypothetical protein